MAKNYLTLMDFVKKQSLTKINAVFDEQCLNEDGTIMSLADQAAWLTKYLHSETSFATGVEPKVNAFRKESVVMMLSALSKEVDVCEYDSHSFGVGYDELRYFSINSNGEPVFESNNVHDWERGEDVYKVFAWEDLTDYEKTAIEDVLKQILKRELAA